MAWARESGWKVELYFSFATRRAARVWPKFVFNFLMPRKVSLSVVVFVVFVVVFFFIFILFLFALLLL